MNRFKIILLCSFSWNQDFNQWMNKQTQPTVTRLSTWGHPGDLWSGLATVTTDHRWSWGPIGVGSFLFFIFQFPYSSVLILSLCLTRQPGFSLPLTRLGILEIGKSFSPQFVRNGNQLRLRIFYVTDLPNISSFSWVWVWATFCFCSKMIQQEELKL